MTDQSIETSSTVPTQETPAPQASALEQLVTATLTEITRPDGSQKYSSPEDLLKGAKEAQAFIPQLQQKEKTMSAELEALKAKLADAEARATSYESKLTEALTLQSSTTTDKVEAPAPAKPEVDIDALIEQRLNQREAQRKAEQSVQSVVSHIQSTLGSSADALYAKLLDENFSGDTKAFAQFAQQSPAAAKRLVDSYKPAPAQVQTKGSSAFLSPKSITNQADGTARLEGESTLDYARRLAAAKGINLR